MKTIDVLLVEALTDQAQTIAKSLQRQGLSVIVCDREQEAINLLANNEFRIVVLAINEVSGPGQSIYKEFLVKYGTPPHCSTLVIAGTPEIKREWYASLADRGHDVKIEINKPYNIDELFSMIKRILKMQEQCHGA